ncbi:DUF3306 domain-containing protein [Telmatospirillum sp. J64-1]|uniref:DUF3306 domain-containing protein n=1 Tax=Telmatospirillum sp. J64-1 TaxID=2502183 RepID=UPI00115D3B9D|nr:DUF3306 domain-containing protein [Telmatospirillum sp. J64-1]
MSGEGGFLRRWSRLKSEAEAPAPAPQEAPEAEALPTVQTEAPAAEEGSAEPEFRIEDLPPVESLTAESDFSVFMQQGVPDDLRRLALRKLWASDPSWAVPDPLDLHNLDYTTPAAGIVASAWRVGQGYAEEALEKMDEESSDSAPQHAAPQPEEAADPEGETPDPEETSVS